VSAFLLQLIMIAADPRRVDRKRLRDAYLEQPRSLRLHVTFEEYAARFYGWYLILTRHVHNTELDA
jgi:hypothetical protein